ncbi:MAG: DUF3800 domain-containing protein [Maritimibacter sp.]
MKYTLYVDESGQSGIKKIRSRTDGGASRYMTLAGVLIPETKKAEIRSELSQLAKEFGKHDLHCNKLNHNQIVKLAQRISRMKIMLFGVISLKETLKGYADDINNNDKYYYNKNAQYLLERVAHFMELHSLTENQLSVVFEEGNFDYQKLRSLLSLCVRNPLKPATRRLAGRVNPSAIRACPKNGDPLLQLADVVAHALYRLVDDSPSTYEVKETRYISEMKARFFSEKDTGEIVGYGIFPVHYLRDIKADADVERFLRELRSK